MLDFSGIKPNSISKVQSAYIVSYFTLNHPFLKLYSVTHQFNASIIRVYIITNKRNL